MTGHGRGEARAEGTRATADVRTVNHRFLDCEVRAALPPSLEADVRRLVERRLFRGRVEVQVAIEAPGEAAAPLRVSVPAMLALVDALREVGREAGITEELRLEHVAALPWARVVEPAVPALSPDQERLVLAAVDEALTGVLAMRDREGSDVAQDLLARLSLVEEHLAAVRSGAAGSAAAHADRLRSRMAELLSGAGIDPDRIAQEAALLADRQDVSEEVTRLGAHLAQLRESVHADGPGGKRLDFTLQEAFREVNTIGSKSRSQPIASRVIEMKTELERMREQVANVE